MVEDDLAAELGLEPGEVVIDFPAKPAMFQPDVLVERRGGEISRLGLGGLPGLLDLPRLAQQLYATARVLRVFTFERREVPDEQVLDRITRPRRQRLVSSRFADHPTTTSATVMLSCPPASFAVATSAWAAPSKPSRSGSAAQLLPKNAHDVLVLEHADQPV